MGEVQAANASQVGPVPIMNSHLWTDRRLTIRVVGPDGERTIDVNKPYARIGSHPRSEVILEGSDVPKHGLYLHATDRGIFSVQLWDSSDEPATHRGWVTPNQGIPLGDCQVFASFTDGPEPVVDPDWMLDEKGSAQLPVPVIYLLVNEERRATYRVYRSLTVVGREKPSALRLRSDFISLTHCVLYWQDNKLWFVDLLSSNGTEKRGRRCEAERFRLGRTIKIGDVLLGFARTTSDPWDPSSAVTVTAREATPPAEPKHIFELNAPQPADARLWSTGDGSSLHNIDGLEDSWEEHGDSDAQLDKDAIEAIKEMRRQLEAERTAWESERIEKERVLADKHRELDRSFAEIQSWRDELSFRSHQLEHDLVARKSAQIAADQAALEEGHHAVAREREELEEQIAQWKIWQKTTQDEHAAITAAHRQQSEQLARQQSELTALAADLERRRQQADAELARKRQQFETDLERQRVQLETDLAALQGRQQAFDARSLSVTQQDQTLAAQQQDLAAQQQNLATQRQELAAQQQELTAQRRQLDETRRELAAEQAAFESKRQSLAAEREQISSDRLALAAERQELESLRQAVVTDRTQLDDFRATYSHERQELESQRKALVTDCTQLDDRRATLSQEQLELESQRKALAAEREELESLRQAHATESGQLDADRHALTAERQELESRLQTFTRESSDAELTRQELETLRRELHAEQQTLAALRQELDISRQSLESERAEIALLRQSAIGASTARGAELEQQHRALSELRLEIAEQQRVLEAQREQWEADQRQSIAAEQQRLTAVQQEADLTAAEQAARIADAERRLALREEQASATETRLQNELTQLATARRELEQAQIVLHDKQRELQQQSEALQQSQAEAHQRLAERQKDVDSLTAELLAQQSVLAAERQELTALCQSLNQDRERAQAEMQEQRSALLATRQEIEALQSQLADDRDASAQIQAELLAQRQQMDEQLQQLRAEREALGAEREAIGTERRELDGERQRLEQFAIEQTELLAMIESERDQQAADQRPRLAAFDDDVPAFASIAADFADDTVDEADDDDEDAVQHSLDYEPVAELNYPFERDETAAELPEAPESFDSEAIAEGTVSDMGQQFEQVDPVLLGEPRTPANPETADDGSDVPPRPVERIPVDPAADAAYDQLVDRLVQFQQSQKRKWFKFW
jgi:chromosome segregation ATPase